jgi:RNA polymerase sigma-70 factor (ECF subfamily)
MDESRLIIASQHGDIHAWNQLVIAHQDGVYSFALRILAGDGDSAADATQKAFIAAWNAIGRYRDGNLRAWLMRIVHNQCYDLLRQQQRHPQTSLDSLTEAYESPAFLTDPGDGPEETLEQGEMWHAIEQCLNRLPDGQRAAVILCDVEGYDYQEIAAILEISLGTVKSRLNRARTRLQECLHSFGELLPDRYR